MKVPRKRQEDMLTQRRQEDMNLLRCRILSMEEASEQFL